MKKGLQILVAFLFFGKIANAQADLTIVGAVSVICPNPVHVGITINVTFSVQNIGSSTASSSRTGIYISPTTNISAGKLLSQISFESLTAGTSSNNIQFNFPITYNSVGGNGTFYIIVKLNDDGAITESNYSNNSANVPIIVDNAPWAAQNIPYPVIFVHGYMSDNTTWDNLIDSMRNTYGWSYGGNMDFCLNYDGNLATSVLASDYHDFFGEPGHILNPNPCDYYTVNFAVNPNGVLPYNNSFESNQAGITKQGFAIRDAIEHVLAVTGRDKVILVCHSMGGLASREYLQNVNLFQISDGKKHVAKLCTIGTPHGGTNITANFLSIIWPSYDGRSEAIRDLRTDYTYSYFYPLPAPNNFAPGTYLFGGVEDLPYMRDQLCCNFHNADVNCDGSVTGQGIQGINSKSIPTDLSYSCGIGSGNILWGISSDGVVGTDKANINNYRSVNADTFILKQPLADINPFWHIELTNQFNSIMRIMDEANDNHNSHAYKISSASLYYGIISYQSISNPPRDYDNYKINIPSNGNLNIQVYSISTPIFSIDVRNSSNISVFSVASNGKSYIDTSIDVTSGNYFIVLSGIPTASSYKYPYAFKCTFSPTTTYCSGTTNLTATSGTFSDGSGSNNYSNNSDCRWKIQPSGATSITLSFSAFNVSNPGDTVYVYDGGTTTSPLLGKFTGSSLPATVTSTGGTMLVRFATDATNTAAGWNADYTSVIVPTFCNGTTILTSTSGAFSDGSGTSDYGNNSHCSWLISPPGAFSITLNFLNFNTEAVNDIVNVYDGNDNTSPLLGSYSGSSIPSTLTSLSGAIFVEFITNTTITASGWNASYTSYVPYSNAGIIEYEYWYDNDYANVVATPVMPQMFFNLNSNIPTANLCEGLHSFHIRFKDNNSQWSSVSSNFIYIPRQITPGTAQYEYWFDNDYTNKISTTVTSTNNLILFNNIATNTLAAGAHTLHIRFRPDGGLWSVVESSDFEKLSVLPVLLTFFNAFNDNCKEIKLRWQTATEINSKEFIIQVSSDGINFYDAGNVPAKGNSSTLVNYSFSLNIFSNGKYYVRLKQVDIDGKINYSKIVLVDISCLKNTFSVYPNPTTNELSISGINNNQKVHVSLYDLNGKLIKVWNNLTTGKISTYEFPSGFYILKINEERFKVIKE